MTEGCCTSDWHFWFAVVLGEIWACAFWSSSIVKGSQSGMSFSISKLTMARASMDPLNCRSWLQAIQWSSCLVRTAKCWDGLALCRLNSNWGLVDTAMAWKMWRKSNGVAVWRSQFNLSRIILSILRISDEEHPQKLSLANTFSTGILSSSSTVLAARKKQLIAIQLKYFGWAFTVAKNLSKRLLARANVSG